MSTGRYAHYLDNVMWNDPTITADATPTTSYSLDVLKGSNPAARVRFGTGTVTITLTFDAPVTATLFALPVSNLAGAVLTLTNGAGLSQAVTLPTLPGNRIPLTAIVTFASSTSAVWHLVISGNAANVILGGCLWLGTYRTLAHNYVMGFREITDQPGPAPQVNDYGVEYLVNLGVQVRTFEGEFRASGDVADALLAWSQDGRHRPTLFWPDPSVNDAFIGHWVEAYTRQREWLTRSSISLRFRELSKGKPV